jgi:hypothetical protein
MGHEEALATIARLTFPAAGLLGDWGALVNPAQALPPDPELRVRAFCIDQVDVVLGGSSDDWLVDLAQIEKAGPNRTSQQHTLPLATGVPVPMGSSAQITAAIQDEREFRCRRLLISNAITPGGAADWIINNINFGNRSQIHGGGDLPGDMFAVGAIDSFVTFELLRPGDDVVVIVTYVGPNANGAPFYGSLVGEFIGSGLQEYKRFPTPTHDIPAGFACVRRTAHKEVTIFLSRIDPAIIDVSMDSILAAGGERTPEVDTVLGQALEGRSILEREAYVAVVMQRAEQLRAEESKET